MSSTEHNIINKQQDINVYRIVSLFILFSRLLNCLHRRLALNIAATFVLLSFQSTCWVYAFLGCNLFVKYPKKTKFQLCQISLLQRWSSVQFSFCCTHTHIVDVYTRVAVCFQQTNSKWIENKNYSCYSFAKQTNNLQKFVNNDDFHDYVVNINLPAHGVEFFWLDDPQCPQCVCKYPILKWKDKKK